MYSGVFFILKSLYLFNRVYLEVIVRLEIRD